MRVTYTRVSITVRNRFSAMLLPLQHSCFELKCLLYLSHVMRKPVYVIYEQQRRRSACASAQSDQRLCCSLPGWNDTYTCYSRNFKTLASLCSLAPWFESNLVANPEDRFSRDVAHLLLFQKPQLFVQTMVEMFLSH